MLTHIIIRLFDLIGSASKSNFRCKKIKFCTTLWGFFFFFGLVLKQYNMKSQGGKTGNIFVSPKQPLLHVRDLFK